VSMLDHTLEPEPVRRLEVITGTGRRRRFSDDYKAGIVEEPLVPGAVVSDVARRHGLTPQQLFGWRRQALSAGVGQRYRDAAVRAGHCGGAVARTRSAWRAAQANASNGSNRWSVPTAGGGVTSG
jgi:transposase-like protein